MTRPTLKERFTDYDSLPTSEVCAQQSAKFIRRSIACPCAGMLYYLLEKKMQGRYPVSRYRTLTQPDNSTQLSHHHHKKG